MVKSVEKNLRKLFTSLLQSWSEHAVHDFTVWNGKRKATKDINELAATLGRVFMLRSCLCLDHRLKRRLRHSCYNQRAWAVVDKIVGNATEKGPAKVKK